MSRTRRALDRVKRTAKKVRSPWDRQRTKAGSRSPGRDGEQRRQRDTRAPQQRSVGETRNRYLDRRTEQRDDGDDTRELADNARITIQYDPHEDGDPDPGEIVWSWVPYEEDPTRGKDRPVVVIGRSGRDMVAVPLTTKHYDDEHQVKVGKGDWDTRGRVSYARVERLVAIDPEAVRREATVLDRNRFNNIIASVDDHYDIITAQ